MSSSSIRQLFLQHVAQTSGSPMALEISHAEGIYVYTTEGKRFIDLVSGVSVSAVGHCHPKVVAAVKEQVEKYMHLMVYGEYIQAPQVLLAEKICSMLPKELSNVYFVNSGSEANEGAMKLAKRYTGRSEIVAFKKCYHGSTQGALSIMGDESYKQNFRPLLPDIRMLEFNNEDNLEQITEKTACVVAEPIQAEGGIIIPRNNFLRKLRERCTKVGALLVFDEVQTGAGRTGTMFAFEQLEAVPDILTIAKAFGGGMPIGAFIAPKHIMETLTHNPVLGHITTFGGHPVSCTAALAALKVIEEDNLIAGVKEKAERFRKSMLNNEKVKEVRGIGLLLAVELGNADLLQQFFKRTLEQGVAIDWFLHCNTAFRIAPPLTITNEQIDEVCEILHQCIG